MDKIGVKCEICGGRGYVFVNHGEEVLKDICDCIEDFTMSDEDGELYSYRGTWTQARAWALENKFVIEQNILESEY